MIKPGKDMNEYKAKDERIYHYILRKSLAYDVSVNLDRLLLDTKG